MPPARALNDSSNSPVHTISTTATTSSMKRTTRDVKGKGRARQVDFDLHSVAEDAIPDPVLLLSLPSELLQSPDQPEYLQSLHVSIDALRACLSIHSSLGRRGSGSLSFEQEMHAHGMIAEVGLKIVDAGLCVEDGPEWARDVVAEIEEAVLNGTRLCQQISTLRPNKPHFTLLRAHLLLSLNQIKACRALLKREIAQFKPSDHSSTVYSSYFTYLTALTSDSTEPSSSTPRNLPPDYPSTLTALNKLYAISETRGDSDIMNASLVSRLQVLLLAGDQLWNLVPETIERLETSLGFTFPEPQPSPSKDPPPPLPQPNCTSPLDTHNKLTTLLLSALYHTSLSQPKRAAQRVTLVHAILDASEFPGTFSNGLAVVQMASGPDLELNVTHPRVFYELAFLVSALSKRDVTGRKPKRGVYLREGLNVAAEIGKVVGVSSRNSIRDLRVLETRFDALQADILCETVSLCIMRSEFADAEDRLARLVAHTRTTGLFGSFSARITLLSAQLAHALGRTKRALSAYRAVAYLEPAGSIGLSARIGEVVLRIGIKADDLDDDEQVLDDLTAQVIKECQTAEDMFLPVTFILEGLRAQEITEIKRSLKSAMDCAGRSSDNHLRALILALMANMYLLTASDHAQIMLKTCQQLAQGLGAPPDKRNELAYGGKVTGNLPLCLWVGEKYAELYKREGKAEKFARQTEINESLQTAMADLLASAEAGNISADTVVAPLSEDEVSMELDPIGPRSPGVDEMDTV